MHQELGCHFLHRRRTETDRIGHAGIEGHAVVRQLRRQVQHVAMSQFPGVERGKGVQHLDRRPFLQPLVVRAADLPALAATNLEQEHIIGIKMRPDRPAGRRIADHQVVDARIRQEIELPQQVGNMRQVVVDVLHQQGPVAFRQAGQPGRPQGAGLDEPAPCARLDQSRLDVVTLRQRRQHGQIGMRADVGKGAPHQQGFFLPVFGQELLGGQSAQKRDRRFHFHMAPGSAGPPDYITMPGSTALAVSPKLFQENPHANRQEYRRVAQL